MSRSTTGYLKTWQFTTTLGRKKKTTKRARCSRQRFRDHCCSRRPLLNCRLCSLNEGRRIFPCLPSLRSSGGSAPSSGHYYNCIDFFFREWVKSIRPCTPSLALIGTCRRTTEEKRSVLLDSSYGNELCVM